MVAGGIPKGCFCLGEDKTKKERGRCIDFFFFPFSVNFLRISLVVWLQNKLEN